MIYFICISFISVDWLLAVTDVTSEINLGVHGIIAGYGDFNSDQATDVFVITNGGKQVDVWAWNTAKQTFYQIKSATINSLPADETIIDLSVTDFNGDGCADVLLSTRKGGNKSFVYVQIYTGNSRQLIPEKEKLEMLDQPTIVDYNGDLLPDLFGTQTDENETRAFWIGGAKINGINQNFTVRPEPKVASFTPVSIPQSNAFVDVTGDMHADLVVKSEPGQGSDDTTKSIYFEVWFQRTGSDELQLNHTFLLNGTKFVLTGRASFVDIDGDEYIDVVVPACQSKDCSKSVIYAKSTRDVFNSQWYVLLNNDLKDWQFSKEDMTRNATFPTQLRFGDFSMDGKVDAVAILEKKGKGTPSKFVAQFVNVMCSKSTATNCEGGATLDVSDMKLGLQNPVSVSFLDVYENGGLDFLVTYQSNGSTFHTKVYKNELVLENAFLKVSVLNGRCYKECFCDKGKTRYGATQVGATVNIDTTNTDGKQMFRKAGQMTSSGYFSLQLPYIVFGLGKSPNFVDEIEVGLPKGPQSVDRKRSWSSIIPNAQVIVIPYPMNEPGEWMTKLLVTPSKMLLQIGGVLLGTMLLIAAFILILHIKERKEDEQEKRKEAHKFHFDAL